jgi:hypothetical protein
MCVLVAQEMKNHQRFTFWQIHLTRNPSLGCLPETSSGIHGPEVIIIALGM